MSCNFATHATCLLAFMVYKYNELQVLFVIQNARLVAKHPVFS